jgi:ketosteroid isomerase-like protein
MSEDQVTGLRELYAAFNRHDIDGVMGVLDPEIEVDPTEDLAYAAALLRVLGPRFMILSAGYRGIDEVLGLFRSVWQIAEWFEVEPLEFLQMEDLVVVPLVLRAKARDDGREGEAETAHLWTLSGGHAVRLRVFPRRGDAVAAALRQLRTRA